MNKPSILVLGRSNSGKSGLFGQLYTRLEMKLGEAFLYRQPENIHAISKITNRLAEQKSITHTPSSESAEIVLNIETRGQKIDLAYPDYGGEQIQELVGTRQLEERWYKAIEQSDSWLMLIRIHDLDRTFDPVQRFTSLVKEGNGERKKENIKETFPADQAYFIELLQMMLHFKNVGILAPITKPRLTIALSCWDELQRPEGTLPADILTEHLPLLSTFVSTNWSQEAHEIIGLSAQGKSLDKDKPDPDYVDFESGYLILPDGSRTSDLTQILSFLIR